MKLKDTVRCLGDPLVIIFIRGEKMTENENKAREILELSFRINMGTELPWHIEKLGYELPILTDEECKNIAVNYPVSLQSIRQAFPRVKL